MPLAAVEQNQVGQPVKCLVLFVRVEIPLKPAAEHLAHACIVVGACHRLDAEFAVAFAQRTPVFKDNHPRNHRIRTDVGNIVGLDIPGRFFQPEQTRQLIECGDLPPGPLAALGEFFRCVLFGHFHQFELFPALWDADFDLIARLLAQ